MRDKSEELGSNSIDLTEARENLTKIVPEAGEIIKKYFTERDYSSRQKAGVDFTTQADEEVDAFLRHEIQSKYPHSQFLTEETAPEDYSSLRNAENLWVIDPLDGTINFSRQHPNFAISVALVDKGVAKLGVVHAPISGDTYWAQADQDSAYLNGNPIHVSTTTDLREVVLGCDWGWDLEKRMNVVKWLSNISTHIRQVKSMGSAVADLASLANGKIDAYMHSGLKPWDVAASTLLIQKAGGKVSSPDGSDWDVFNPDIFASNGILHSELLELLNQK